MHFHLVSLFPEFFSSPLDTALIQRARQRGIVRVSLHNPREHGQGAHLAVDDRPYGGGPGMVLMLEPVLKTLRAIKDAGRILVMSPAGKPFTQAMAQALAQQKSCTLVCGRYEGFDARLEQILPVEYVSMGDAVLNGGEVPALAIMEAVARLVPGFMGKEASGTEESFSAGLLEYPHYTRPESFEGHAVPAVLSGGNHQAIAQWRREAALDVTLQRRPDLLETAALTQSDAVYLRQKNRTHVGRNLSIALVHHPVIIENNHAGTSSLTNLDIHDIARTCRTYGLAAFYVVMPMRDQQEILRGILRHWSKGHGGHTLQNEHHKRTHDRAQALACVHPVCRIEDAVTHVEKRSGKAPQVWASSAQWAEKSDAIATLHFQDARDVLHTEPALLLLGTAHGLAKEALHMCHNILPPVRFLSDYNHLSVRAAAAIMVDRIVGELH